MKQRLVEIRSYKLKPGQAAAFHDAVVNQAVPMLKSLWMSQDSVDDLRRSNTPPAVSPSP